MDSSYINVGKNIKKLESNSKELDLIIDAILSKQDKLNSKDRAVLKKQLKRHEDIEDRLYRLENKDI